MPTYRRHRPPPTVVRWFAGTPFRCCSASGAPTASVADRSAALAALGDEVLGVHEQAAVGRLVAPLGHRVDLLSALLPASLRGEALACLERRAVVGLHEDDVVLGRVEPPRVVAVRELELNTGVREQLAHVLLVAPPRRWRGVVGRSREVRA